MIKSLYAILVAAVSLVAAGQESDELKKGNRPGELYVSPYIVGDCFSQTESMVESIIEAELTRARVKRISEMDFGLWMVVKVQCINTKVGGKVVGLAYQISSVFIEMVDIEGPFPKSPALVYYQPFDHDILGIAPDDAVGRQAFRYNIRDSVEEALTDYLKANFPEERIH